MAWMHPDFSFQGSRPVTKGFKDPRDPEVGLGHTMTFKTSLGFLKTQVMGIFFQNYGYIWVIMQHHFDGVLLTW